MRGEALSLQCVAKASVSRKGFVMWAAPSFYGVGTPFWCGFKGKQEENHHFGGGGGFHKKAHTHVLRRPHKTILP